jgi:FMN reductase
MTEIIGFVGSQSQPSRTRALVTAAVQETARQTGLGHAVFDLGDMGASLGAAGSLADLAPEARAHVDRLLAARAIVVGSPVYKGSYTGLFKHLFDLIAPEALRGKPVLLTATGGGDRHALVIEHQLRPLFGFFEAETVPTGIYASATDFADGVISSPDLESRITQAAEQLARNLGIAPSRANDLRLSA